MTRALTSVDAAEMSRLHAAAFTPGWPQSDMEGHAQSDICIGLGHPLSGFIILRTAADQAEILTIVTGPSARRTGIGQKLLDAAESKALAIGIEIIFLEVAEDNLPAIALYKKSGYEAFGKRPAYYRRENGRVAALTLRKRLDAPPANL